MNTYNDANNIKISIIIPIYNVEPYIAECLDSLVNQTLKDIEIICVNDASPDNSWNIVQKYAQNDNRFVLINLPENHGQGYARNVGLDKASGEYIAFVDADDWANLDMYEQMYNQAKMLNSDIVLSNYIRYLNSTKQNIKKRIFSKAVSSIDEICFSPSEGENLPKDVIKQMLLVSPCYSVNRIYRKELLISKKILFPTNRCYEDCIFILRTHLEAKNISYINKFLYYYRIHQTSTLRSNSKRYYDFYQTLTKLEEYLDFYKNENWVTTNLTYFSVMNSVWIYETLQKKEQKEMIAVAQKFLTPKNYKIFCKVIKRNKYKKKSWIQKILSFQKTPKSNIVTILGLKIKISRKKTKQERKWIKKIKRNLINSTPDTYLLFDCLVNPNTECIDAYSLFCYMQQQGIKSYYVLLTKTKLYQKLKQNNQLNNIIGIEYDYKKAPEQFLKAVYKILPQTKCIITSFGELPPETHHFLVANQTWQYIFIQHGVIFLKENILDWYLLPEKYNKVLISSEFEYNLFKAKNWPDNKLIKAGLPRWDLLNSSPKTAEKSILIMLTWRRGMTKEKFINSLYKKNLLDLLKTLKNNFNHENIKFYFAPHHAVKRNMGLDLSFNDYNIETIDSDNMSSYIRQCDCLITDISSVAFDFMFQNKPVLFYLLDKGDKYLIHGEKEDFEKMEKKKEVLPNIFEQQEKMLNKLQYYIENNFTLTSEETNQYNKFFYIKNNIRATLIEKLNNDTELR